MHRADEPENAVVRRREEAMEMMSTGEAGATLIAHLLSDMEAGVEGHGIVLVVRAVPEPTEDDLRETTSGLPLPDGFGPALSYLYLIDVRPTEQ